jgi:hypothetical protein
MTWTARNDGLTGTALNSNNIVQRPNTKNLNSTSHELLLPTDDGLYHSVNGGRQWAKIPLPDPTGGGATVDELTFHWVDYSPLDSNIVFVLAVKVSTSQVWIYKSIDDLLSWISRLVVTA